jgi:hypothetical protein
VAWSALRSLRWQVFRLPNLPVEECQLVCRLPVSAAGPCPSLHQHEDCRLEHDRRSGAEGKQRCARLVRSLSSQVVHPVWCGLEFPTLDPDAWPNVTT